MFASVRYVSKTVVILCSVEFFFYTVNPLIIKLVIILLKVKDYARLCESAFYYVANANKQVTSHLKIEVKDEIIKEYIFLIK